MEKIPLNSLLGAVFVDDELRETIQSYPWPEKKSLDTLSMVSALYLYTEPPPNGYGTPGPKVFESVKRAWEFNKKKSNSTKKIGDFVVNWAVWDVPEEYPFDETTGNWHAGAAHQMYQTMLKDHFDTIRTITNQVTQNFLVTNSDVLTKGKQTWDSIRQRSVPSPTAYNEMAKLFRENLGREATNCLEWLQSYFECMNLENLRTLILVNKKIKKMRFDKTTKQKVATYKKIKVLRKETITGNTNVRIHMFNLSREFCSYIKHGERAKLNRRAIASPNMIKRMFLKIVETVHLKLSKTLPGSTISIGGEEKKNKISDNLVSADTASISCHKLQATQDATKWNECLSPETFLMMHRTFYDPGTRRELGLPPPTDMESLFLKIAEASHWILANKTITLGEGPTAISKDGKQNRLEWKPKHLPRFNKNTREQMEPVIHHFLPNNKMYASPGMLMGMHNAASTTLALGATGFGLPSGSRVITLRSSDDSMTVFVTSSANAMAPKT